MQRSSADAGFTLIEMLVASLIMMVITGGVFTLLNPAHGVFRSQPEAADMQQRLRVGVDALSTDLMMAGRGIPAGPSAGPLLDYFAPVLPYRVGDADDDAASGVFYRPDTMTVIYVASTSAQATIATPLSPGAQDLTLDASPSCPPPGVQQLCGFAEKTRALLFDASGAWNLMTVTAAHAPILQVRYSGALATTYAPGSILSEVVTHTYYLKRDAATGLDQLMRYDGAQTDLPVVDNVVALRFSYFGAPEPPSSPTPPALDVDRPDDLWPAGENCAFIVADGKQVPRQARLGGVDEVELGANVLTDGPWCVDEAHVNRFDADLLRVRRVRVTLRVQAAAAALRGPAGVLFMHGGTSAGAGLVPDQEISFDVSPRNLSLGR
jgi:prepilin-type N-terminal cleavage/methylation domain-containing protein